jgi:predicted aldo/keto reductase-like oxidoreductase
LLLAKGKTPMNIKNKSCTRRAFLKAAGITGAGSVIAPFRRPASASEGTGEMPLRPFGNTGINVPILSFGGSLDTSLSMLVLRQAFKWGVTYWDTANTYMGGRSEKGFGKYFIKYPQDRPKVFLVTKTHAWTLKGMSQDLDSSLERMKTDYIDLYFLHSIRRTDQLDNEIKSWAEKMKAKGKIRLFGFSTHSNMEECMLGGSKLGWIDGIMMTYNYRLMHSDDMRRAVDACAEAGIGLTAMKTQGGGQVQTNSETELKLAGRFVENGFTDAQAKLKAVWENPNIASICSEMPNMTILMANAAAAKDKSRLSSRDRALLHQYAQETRSAFCAGCADLCESAVAADIPIGDIMRYLMYARGYDNPHRACRHFRKIPPDLRIQAANADYAAAEKRCPQKMAIGRLMKEAIEELS